MAFQSKHGVSDMVMLSKVTESAIVSNLSQRFKNDLIYTWIGPVLVSVNPFRNIKDLYSDRKLKEYYGKYRYETPSHIYATADQVYRQLLSECANQCVIISGESGAGKTEASKKILQFIASVSSNSTEVQRVKDVILSSNPLLEAFGNAKTLRNNNSSRFGKYMEIQFNLRGDPEGGLITNYLLEKSRVVHLQEGERNFHIFYQFLKGASPEERQRYCLMTPRDYHYLNQSSEDTVNGIDDVKEWNDTLNAMRTMNMTEEEIDQVKSLLAAVLTIGNVDFREDDSEAAHFLQPELAETIAYLLGTDAESVIQSLTLRSMTSGSARNSLYKSPQTRQTACYARDALAKSIYSKLFDWIVQKVNTAMYVNAPDDVTIGILDIYGFEIFDNNGFEQLCINFVNEKLQQIFIELTLKQEQEEYASEGIKWEPIPFFNNKIVCDLIESKNPIGIFALLDDVCNFPRGSDESFHSKMGERFSSHGHYEHYGGGLFRINHYAGEVDYNTNGFLDKNKDILHYDLIELMGKSSLSLAHTLFPEAFEKRSKKRPTTAAHKIKESINELVHKLGQCTPHYIRCMKPNDNKRGNDFNDKRMTHQAKYLGLLENVKVRRAGFAYRHEFRPFFYRYRVLSDKCWPQWSSSDAEGAREIVTSVLGLSEGKDFQMGKTKLFIRAPEAIFSLEEKREQAVFSYASRIQRFFQKFALQQLLYERKMSANAVVKGHKQRRRLSIEFERPYASDYVNMRDNFDLKALLPNRHDKVHFVDCVNLVSSGGLLGKLTGLKSLRRILICTSTTVYIVAIQRNKDKADRVKRPYVYAVTRSIGLQQVQGVQLSTLRDGYVLISVSGEHHVLAEIRRKVEFLGVLQRLNNSIRFTFNNSFNVVFKGNKSRTLTFVEGDEATDGDGRLKKNQCFVAKGHPCNEMPPIQEPAHMPTVSAPRQQMVRKAAPKRAPHAAKRAPHAAKRAPQPQPAQRSVPAYMSKPKTSPKKTFSPKRAFSPKKSPRKAFRGPKGPGARKGPKGARNVKNVRKGVKNARKGVKKGRKGPKKGRKSPPKKGRPVAQARPKRVRMLYDFEAMTDEELSVRAGDVLELVNDTDPEWFEVRTSPNSRVGIVPKNYSQIV